MRLRPLAALCVVFTACGSGTIADDDAVDGAVVFDAIRSADAALVDAAQLDAAPFSLTVAVISDLNGSYGSTSYGSYVHAAVARIIAVDPDLVLSAGDMVAGQQSGLDYEAMWDGFHAAVSDPLAMAGIPLAVTPGNHDASAYSGYAAERAIYAAEWQARIPAVTFIDDAGYPFRYSFALGDARFISIDDTRVGALSTDQMSWLAGQLANPDDYAATIVFGHLPLYPVGVGTETAIIGDPALETLLVDSDADLLISGHVHAYYPGRRASGLRLLSMSCQGSGPNELIGEDFVRPRSIVTIEISATGVTYDAYTGASFDELVTQTSLPESIGSGAELITRDDL